MSLEELEALNNFYVQPKAHVIFVYTPPKVGSSTLVSTLRLALGKTHAIVHLHDNNMMHFLTQNKYNTNITVNDLIKYNACVLRRNVYVINIYRPTYQRKLSEYFEQIATLHFNRTEDEIAHYPLSVLMSRFDRIYRHVENGDHYFNMYDIPEDLRIKAFDHEKKYVHHRVLTTYVAAAPDGREMSANINYVLLRLKDANTHWIAILEELFNKPAGTFKLINENKRDMTTLKDKYAEFLANYKWSDMYEVCDKWGEYYETAEERATTIKNIRAERKTEREYTEEEYAEYLRVCVENSIGRMVSRVNYEKSVLVRKREERKGKVKELPLRRELMGIIKGQMIMRKTRMKLL